MNSNTTADTRPAIASTKKTILFLIAGIAINVLVLFHIISPMKRNSAVIAEELKVLSEKNDQMHAFIQKKAATQERINILSGTLNEITQRNALAPLLNSYAMRAKELLSPLARKNSLSLENVKILAPIPLQQPHTLNEPYFIRQPIEFSSSGTYFQIASFITEVETNFPMTVLSSLSISSQSRDPEIHKISFSFEWLTRTEKSLAQ